MRFRLLTGATALGLMLAVAVAVGTATGGQRPAKPAAFGAGVQGQAKVFVLPSVPNVTLFDNNNNDSGVGISSQNFPPADDKFDDAAADDFVVPMKTTWKVKEVDVTGGYFQGVGPAVSENVTFYKDNGGAPGTVVKAFNNVAGTDNGTGSFVIKLKGAKLKGGKTAATTYWVSVQINMDMGVGGQWHWEGSLNAVANPDVWENPGNGWGTGCTTWGLEYTCVGDQGQGPSKMFTLKGTHKP